MDELDKKEGPPQRKRVSKACDRCRRRKDKCDGKKPVCWACEQSSAACSWNPLSKKRGLPDGYVRGLEKISGAIFREVPGIEELLLTKFSGDEEALYDYWGDDGTSNSPLELWKNSRLVKELDRLLPILDSLSKKGKKRTWEESEGLVTSQNIVSSPKPVQNDTVPTIMEDEPISSVLPQSKPAEVFASVIAPLDSISSSNDWPLPSGAGRLVEAYFSYTHTWLPIIERHDLLRVLYQGPRSKITRSPGENAALWAVIAYAEVQYSIISSPELGYCSDTPADLFYCRAKSLIPVVDGEYELGHVQASLILAILKVGLEDWKSAWILVGHAIRIAVNLELDLIPLNAEQSKLPRGEKRRKHVFLACFVLDTIVAARLSRTPYLRSQDVEEVGVLDEEGLEEWDHWNDCLGIRRASSASLYQATTLSTFNNLIQLVQILSDIICFDAATKPTNSDNNHGNADNRVTVFCSGIIARLDLWKASHTIDENLAIPSRCNLYLTYLSIIMALNLRYPSDAPLHLGQNTIQFVKLYAENFGLLVLPPIFEYSLKLAGDCIRHPLNASNNAKQHSNASWTETWQHISTALSGAWPVFQLSNLLPQFDMVTLNRPGISKMASKQPDPTLNVAPSLPQATPDHWQVPQLVTPTAPIETTPRSFHLPSQVQQPQPQLLQPQFPPARMEPTLDQNSIFQEVYDMDANLWSNTWEQSLLNLGFTGEGQSLDEEFYSFFEGEGGSMPEKFNVIEQPSLSTQLQLQPQVHPP